MLSKEILNKIETKQITSRRQLYKEKNIFRSKKLINWLNQNNLLMPKLKWTKERLIKEMKLFAKELNRLPKANERYDLTDACKRLYGNWNNGLLTIFGEINQNRYNFDKNSAKKVVYDFIKKEQRLPNREEFNGKYYPYWESITTTLNVNKWSDIYKEIDITSINYFPNKYHGTGKVFVYKGDTFLSHQEYLIGKYLYNNNIKYEKEVLYDNSNYIFDFYLPKLNIYIEYYGLSDRKKYKEKITDKQKYYKDRKVIEIFKHDNTIQKLDTLIKEVQRL
jgi:hypothetical protein